jgi:transposase-like protein
MMEPIYDGLGEMEYYLKAEMPSPCLSCDRLEEEKEICSIECVRLTNWQVKAGALSPVLPGQDVKHMGEAGERLCRHCEGRLRYEDRVIYCVECLTVHMRLRKKETSAQFKYLLGEGWTPDQIAKVFKKDRAYVMAVGHKLGFSFDQRITTGEKLAIVDYTLLHGSMEASQKFGYHPETINRYCREMGFGAKKRFYELKRKARRLFDEGISSAEAAKMLGVNKRTAKAWKNKWELSNRHINLVA